MDLTNGCTVSGLHLINTDLSFFSLEQPEQWARQPFCKVRGSGWCWRVDGPVLVLGRSSNRGNHNWWDHRGATMQQDSEIHGFQGHFLLYRQNHCNWLEGVRWKPWPDHCEYIPTYCVGVRTQGSWWFAV